MNLSDDRRWLRLHDSQWTCPCCKQNHNGVFDLAIGKPDSWPGDEEARPNSELANLRNILTQDFCVLDGEHFFVRCFLHIPIIGSSSSDFAFGVWSSLAKQNFNTYVRTFNSDKQQQLGPWFGWLSNQLIGYPDTLHLKCQVHPVDGGGRPHIELEPTDHLLSFEQRNGITFDRLLDIYAANGHDVRDALSN